MTTKETVMYSFHCTLQEIAANKGVTADDIARATGLSKNTVKRHLENDPILTRIDAKTVMRLQAFLDLDNWQLLFEPNMTETRITQQPVQKASRNDKSLNKVAEDSPDYDTD